MRRIGELIKIRPERLEEYKAYHADPWPEVNRMIKECNITNYSIYHYGEYLFACYEYTGEDYEGDMAKMAADPATQKWWEVVKPCQQSLEEPDSGSWWTGMEEVYHLE